MARTVEKLEETLLGPRGTLYTWTYVHVPFFGSRRAPDDPSELTCGPFRLEVIEPMREIRVVLDDNESGVACDLTFRARTACVP